MLRVLELTKIIFISLILYKKFLQYIYIFIEWIPASINLQWQQTSIYISKLWFKRSYLNEIDFNITILLQKNIH